MKKLLFLLFITSPALATDVVVVNSTDNPANVICVSGCSGSGGAQSSTFTLVNTATVTFNGISQPVDATQDGTYTETPGTGTWPTYLVNPTTTTFGGIAQQVTSTYTTIVSTGIPIFQVDGTTLTINPPTQLIGSQVFTGIGQLLTVNTSGYSVISFQVNGSIAAGTIGISGSADNLSTPNLLGIDRTNNAVVQTLTNSISNHVITFQCGGLRTVSASSAGTWTNSVTLSYVLGNPTGPTFIADNGFTNLYTTVTGTVAVVNNLATTLSVSGSMSVSNTPTVTFAVGQPVTSTSTYLINPATVTFNGIAQQVTSTSTYLINLATVTFNGIAQQVTSTSTYLINPATVTFNGIAQQVTSTYTVISDTYNIGVMDNYQSLVKGVQASTGVTVQELKDSGRSFVILVATNVAGTTTDTIFSSSKNVQGVVTAPVTSYTITSGKTLRIQGLYCSNRDGTTTISWSKVSIRHNTGGATTAASPVIFAEEFGGSAALAGAVGNMHAPFPDGIEIFGDGTKSIGMTHLDQATTNVVTCTLVGYEY